MHDSLNITSPSPDARHTAHFTVSGEIRFGPLYYSLAVDGYSFGRRIFGDAHLWSPSSMFLAVQEWLTIDYSEGPITVLALIDVALRREIAAARTTKGFAIPEAFEGSTLVYRKEYRGQAIERCELDTATITGWKALV